MLLSDQSSSVAILLVSSFCHFIKSFYILKSKFLQNARDLNWKGSCWLEEGGLLRRDGCSGVCEGLRNFQMHEVTLISVSPAAFQRTEKPGCEWGPWSCYLSIWNCPFQGMYLHVCEITISLISILKINQSNTTEQGDESCFFVCVCVCIPLLLNLQIKITFYFVMLNRISGYLLAVLGRKI